MAFSWPPAHLLLSLDGGPLALQPMPDGMTIAFIIVATIITVIVTTLIITNHAFRKHQGIVILLTGYKRSGKDTVGDRLCSKHNFERVAFADPLRDIGLVMLREQYTTPDAKPEWFTREELKEKPLVWTFNRTASSHKSALVIDFEEEDGTFSGDAPAFVGDARLTPRELLKWFGMLLRNHAYKNIWRDLAARRMHATLKGGRNVVVTDARFSNEKSPAARAELLRMLAPHCWRVELWRVHDDDAMAETPTEEELEEMHPSEAQIHLHKPDVFLDNTRSLGTINDLQDEVDDIMTLRQH